MNEFSLATFSEIDFACKDLRFFIAKLAKLAKSSRIEHVSKRVRNESNGDKKRLYYSTWWPLVTECKCKQHQAKLYAILSAVDSTCLFFSDMYPSPSGIIHFDKGLSMIIPCIARPYHSFSQQTNRLQRAARRNHRSGHTPPGSWISCLPAQRAASNLANGMGWMSKVHCFGGEVDHETVGRLTMKLFHRICSGRLQI